MQVGQAILSAASTSQVRNCELIARSPDVDDALAAKLIQWSPGFWEMTERQTESLNFFVPIKDKLAFCRSVFACSEYGRAEGGRLITLALILDPQQLGGYDHNIVLFATTIRSMGLMTLQTHSTGERLARLEVPERTIFSGKDCVERIDKNTASKIERAIDIHRKVAIFGRIDPLRFLCALLAQMSAERRCQTSFSTALKISEARTFQLHFFPQENPSLKKDLVQAQVRTITLEPHEIPPTFARAGA